MSESDFKYKNKRILQIIPNMEIGGAERTVIEITNFLKEKKILPLVLTSGGKLINDLEKANVEVIKLPIDKKNPYSIIKNFFIFIKIFREKEIDLVHVRSRAPAWSAIFAANGRDQYGDVLRGDHRTNGRILRSDHRDLCQRRPCCDKFFVHNSWDQTR